MTDEVAGEVVVDLGIFPLPIIKKALYVLSDRIDGRIGEKVGSKLTIRLSAVAGGLDAAGMERAFNQALIAASVNEQAFQAAAPIRNYLAQTAFSITTRNQQTIEEFAASLGGQRGDEHAGSPTYHIDISGPPSGEPPHTEAGNRLILDEDGGQAVLCLDRAGYLLPDVLWAANEMRDTCICLISNLPGSRLLVQIQPNSDEADADLAALAREFERWLMLAAERAR